MTEPGPRFYFAAVAVIDGWPAYAIGRMLARHCHDEIADLPPHLRRPIEAASEALRLAGAAWVSARGSAEAALPEAPVSSEHERDGLDTREVAGVLRVSQRRVRQLVASGALPAHKRQGRWTFERGAVTEINNDRGARHE